MPAPPTQRIWFWNYDPDSTGWHVYGLGRVSQNRKQIVPDPGVVIYGFSGAMVIGVGAPATGSPPGNTCSGCGDPIDLSTGLFIYTHTDLVLPDVIPLALTRTYRESDPYSRAFGIGTTHPYDIFLYTPNGDADIYLILPDGGRIHFIRDVSDTFWVCKSSPTSYYGSTLTFYPAQPQQSRWVLRTKDGTTLTFPESDFADVSVQHAAITAFQDRYGNVLHFTRDNNSNLTEISSPNGRYIQFTLDSGGRITKATDNLGRVVSYIRVVHMQTGSQRKIVSIRWS